MNKFDEITSDDDDDDDKLGLNSCSATEEKDGEKTRGKKKRLRLEIESLHKEMEVTGYAKGKMGHRQRKLPRDVSKIRTQKRKLLEKLDDKERAIMGEDDDEMEESLFGKNRSICGEKRLRGSRAAAEDSVIRGSLIFQAATSSEYEKNENQGNGSQFNTQRGVGEVQNASDHKSEEKGEVREGEDRSDVDDRVSDVDTDSDLGEESERHAKEGMHRTYDANQNNQIQLKNKKKAASSRSTGPTTKKRRRMYRLRNFQSFKMAQKHGDALSAHARGQPRLAIEKLKAVASAAPSAPQVYSSLGLVYEDMLKESRNGREHQRSEGAVQSHESTEKESRSEVHGNEGCREDSIPSTLLAEQYILATKAYGAHHIAAILCKKDFTLWVRAGDSANDIAKVHDDVIQLPNLSKKLSEYHISERRRWQNEALRDYIVADNLKPPGIDVPARVAQMHMDLGKLSESLTILTDLKNRCRSEFQRSYRAWMLYSDLMLRFGHECLQWNKGIQTNENYMFRRWLRKFSKSFDWQERRLQALSLAFEAAAGTQSAEGFLKWIRKRIIIKAREQKERDSEKRHVIHVMDDTGQSLVTHDSPEVESAQKREIGQTIDAVDFVEFRNKNGNQKMEIDLQFLDEKKLITLNQSQELQFFDKTTSEMDLVPDSAVANDRKRIRNKLLKSHDDALNRLQKEYFGNSMGSIRDIKEGGDDEVIMGMNTDPLHISGSITTVCSIGSELMKHLLGLGLFDGAKHVGDSISYYMKERARRYDDAINEKKKADEWQQKIRDSPFFLDSYDDDDCLNEDSDLVYISDDEKLLTNEGDVELLKSLRNGHLTPELRVLYGLALLGLGGLNFVAANCLRAIDDLKHETEEWFEEENCDKGVADPYWILFRKAMTQELYRTGAFAFVADILKKTRKENEWAFHFAPLFRRHVDNLELRGLSEKLLLIRGEMAPNLNFKKNQLLKVIVQACKFELQIVEKNRTRKYVLNKSPSFTKTKQSEIAQEVLARMARLVQVVWVSEGNGDVPPICVEIVKILANCVTWFSEAAEVTEMPFSVLQNTVNQCTSIISQLCGTSFLKVGDIMGGDLNCVQNTKAFPFTSTWQPTELRMLSIRTYNFAVACNVSRFSGWEREEFTMKSMKRLHGNHGHFGVHLGNKRLAGCLPEMLVEKLNRQWAWLARELPAFPPLNFAEKMDEVKKSEWFRAEVRNRENTLRTSEIAVHGEEDALKFFLAYASVCLHLSQSTTDKIVAARCEQAAFSILLPLSQFCLDEDLWDSDVGDAASTLASYEEWQIMTGRTQYHPIDTTEGLPKRARKSGKKLVYDKKVQEWIEGSGSATSKDFIAIPNTEFKKLWGHSFSDMYTPNTTDANLKMSMIQKIASDLRGCYTYSAAEKACLNLSTALLEIAAEPSCHNPFQCLQQAALFASQGAKFGNSDRPFRKTLPSVEKCSPREALIILGRADCLHSVYFPNEAAYLCSFVARVCRLHRDARGIKFKWSDQWKVVGIYAYNVSVMIRITVANILNQAMQKAFMTAWDRDVVEELERGRMDGRSWINSLKRSAESNDPDSGIRRFLVEKRCEQAIPQQSRLVMESDVTVPFGACEGLNSDTKAFQSVRCNLVDISIHGVGEEMNGPECEEGDEDTAVPDEVVQYCSV